MSQTSANPDTAALYQSYAYATLNQRNFYFANLSFTSLTDFTFSITDGSTPLMTFAFDNLGNITVGGTTVGSYAANSSYYLEYDFTPLVGTYSAQVIGSSGLIGAAVTGSVPGGTTLPGDLGMMTASNTGAAPVYLDSFGLGPVPEPSTVALFLSGLIATGTMALRRKGRSVNKTSTLETSGGDRI